jgi:hypothetical protein
VTVVTMVTVIGEHRFELKNGVTSTGEFAPHR